MSHKCLTINVGEDEETFGHVVWRSDLLRHAFLSSLSVSSANGLTTGVYSIDFETELESMISTF